jgi:segregation and condensation protein B
MSLKAKLEAVIYAAEEPVALAQLALLFAGDAFAWKAERDAQIALEIHPEVAQSPESPDDILDLPLNAPARESSAEDAVRTAAFVAGMKESIAAPDLVAEAAKPTTEVDSESAGDAELEARRIARQREREAREILRGILDELIAEYAQDDHGIEIREIAGGFRMGTKPEIHDAVRSFARSLKPPMKLSLPALETLAVIAYKQPVTAPEVGEIRGVDSAGVLGSLMSRKLIATAGRKQVIGRPMLYKTTKEFLLRFGLKDLSELPSMEEFEKMAVMELNEESLDEEPAEPAGPVEESGDLFAEPETTGGDLSKSNAVSQIAEMDEPDRVTPASNAVSTEVPIPTAEPSEQAAEAQALVERQNAEEVEVEQ